MILTEWRTKALLFFPPLCSWVRGMVLVWEPEGQGLVLRFVSAGALSRCICALDAMPVLQLGNRQRPL